MGDKLLLTCARVLSEALGPKECCGRISADNFVLLLQYQSWEQLTLRLTACVDKLDQWRKEETEIPNRIHVVFGVYLTGQAEDPDIHQMIDVYKRQFPNKGPGTARRPPVLSGKSRTLYTAAVFPFSRQPLYPFLLLMPRLPYIPD